MCSMGKLPNCTVNVIVMITNNDIVGKVLTDIGTTRFKYSYSTYKLSFRLAQSLALETDRRDIIAGPVHLTSSFGKMC
jgi:hypothetical protein